MTATDLKTHTAKDLAEMARKKGVHGWHSMRKDQLIKALVKVAKAAAAKRPAMPATAKKIPAVAVAANGTAKAHAKNGAANGVAKNGHAKAILAKNGHAANGHAANGHAANGHAATAKNGTHHAGNGHAAKNGRSHSKPPAPPSPQAEAARKARSARIERKLREIRARLAQSKDLAFRSAHEVDTHSKDRIVVMVRDPFWLHTYWEVNRASVERARAALGQHWHEARPVLRLYEITADGTTSTAHQVVRHIEIHGSVNNWYIDVHEPPKTYQVEIGYLAPSCSKFFSLARSNVVTTPSPTEGKAADRNWPVVAQDYDHIYALSGGYSDEHTDCAELREVLEERLQRPMGPPASSRFSLGNSALQSQGQDLQVEIDAELLVFGATDANARVTVRGEPVRLDHDGSFMLRFNLPDRRQVLPIVASRGDGTEQRTIVLAVERNTKVMESGPRDGGE